MDPVREIDVDMSPFIIIYKSGRVERLIGTETVPPSLDPATGFVSKDVAIDAAKCISARLFLPQVIISAAGKKQLPILVYYHGGAFCTSSPFTPGYTSYLNSLVSKNKIIAVSADYRLAPENLLPAAYDDSEVALNWVLSSQDAWLALYGDLGRAFMAGDSAGANVTHQMAIRTEGQEKIEGIVLFDAHFWGSEPVECETTDPEVRGWYKKMRTTINLPGVDEDHPTQNPLTTASNKIVPRGPLPSTCGTSKSRYRDAMFRSQHFSPQHQTNLSCQECDFVGGRKPSSTNILTTRNEFFRPENGTLLGGEVLQFP